jgi:hypothetical protein
MESKARRTGLAGTMRLVSEGSPRSVERSDRQSFICELLPITIAYGTLANLHLTA